MVKETIEAIVKVGIPVMGHVGLTPQSVHRFGGYKIQGKNKEQREAVMDDALAVEGAGAFGWCWRVFHLSWPGGSPSG